MLFTAKRDVRASLALFGLFLLVGLAGRRLFGIPWNFAVTPTALAQVGLGIGAVFLSDGLVQVGLWFALGDRFLATYGRFVGYFRGQTPAAILAGGLLAVGEEMVFRGIVLQVLLERSGPAPALVVSSVLFGAFHVIERGELGYFAAWAVWEGALLGVLYLLSGSLFVAAAVHFVHDVGGFALFGWERRHGPVLAAVNEAVGR